MKTEVRDNILDIGVDIIIKKGYYNVGIQEVLNKAEIPKGSFYHYFKNKEDFGIQIIRHYNEKALVLLERYFNDMTKTPRERMMSFFIDMKGIYSSKEYREGCLIGNCSVELADNSEVVKNVIAFEFDKWHISFENCILEAQKIKEIKSDKSASDMADFILNSWEGALLRMKSSKSPKPLEIFIEFLTAYII